MIEAVDETGAVLPEAVSAGASAELTKDFTTGEQVIDTFTIAGRATLFGIKIELGILRGNS